MARLRLAEFGITHPPSYNGGSMSASIKLGDKITMDRKMEKRFGFKRGTVLTVLATCSGGKVKTLRKTVRRKRRKV